MKSIAYMLLGNKKSEWHYNEPWLGDELGAREKFRQEVRLKRFKNAHYK